MFQQLLGTLGLDEKEAKTYEQIVRSGRAKVKSLLRELPYKRGDLYNILARLEKRGLILRQADLKILTYMAADPSSLEDLVVEKRREVEDAKARISMVRSQYNLALGRPGVRFYEGLEGIKEVMTESLASKGELLSYEDIEGLHRHLPEFAKWYEAQRAKKKIRERAIVPDTALARSIHRDTAAPFREQVFIPHKLSQFSLELDIYDDRVFYVTFRDPFIAVVIEDKNIADTQRAIFELTWRSLRQGKQ